ncbi:hypothetical protein RI367_001998 [Sorochytrium milnesiophthora]
MELDCSRSPDDYGSSYDDGDIHGLFELTIVQQAKHCRISGENMKDRRILDPPVVLQMHTTDTSDLNDHADLLPFFIIHVTLWSVDLTQEMTALPISLLSDTLRSSSRLLQGYHPSMAAAMEGQSARILMGSLVENGQWLEDPHGQLGFYFVFSDLRIRLEGQYRLRFSLFHLQHTVSPVRSYMSGSSSGSSRSGSSGSLSASSSMTASNPALNEPKELLPPLFPESPCSDVDGDIPLTLNRNSNDTVHGSLRRGADEKSDDSSSVSNVNTATELDDDNGSEGQRTLSRNNDQQPSKQHKSRSPRRTSLLDSVAEEALSPQDPTTAAATKPQLSPGTISASAALMSMAPTHFRPVWSSNPRRRSSLRTEHMPTVPGSPAAASPHSSLPNLLAAQLSTTSSASDIASSSGGSMTAGPTSWASCPQIAGEFTYGTLPRHFRSPQLVTSPHYSIEDLERQIRNTLPPRLDVIAAATQAQSRHPIRTSESKGDLKRILEETTESSSYSSDEESNGSPRLAGSVGLVVSSKQQHDSDAMSMYTTDEDSPTGSRGTESDMVVEFDTLFTIHSDVVTAYNPKRFPGMIASTDLTRCFARQGVRLVIRDDRRVASQQQDKQKGGAKAKGGTATAATAQVVSQRPAEGGAEAGGGMLRFDHGAFHREPAKRPG